METKETLSKLRGIVNKTASGLTREDKQYIAERAQEYGITIRKRCGSCYIDAAVELFGKLSKEAEPEKVATDKKYVLKAGVDVLHNGVRINSATLTDELAERMIKNGLSLVFFAKYPSE